MTYIKYTVERKPVFVFVITLILHFPLNSIVLQADYVTVVEDRPIMCVNIVSQFQSSTFGHN